MKKLIAFVLCAATLLTCSVCGTVSAETAETDNTAKLDVRAMSFNIRYMLEDSYDAISYSASQRKKVVVDQIKNYSPDLLGVQEDTGEWLNVLKPALSDYATYTGPAVEGTDSDNSYNTIFYKKERFEFVSSGTKWLTDDGTKKLLDGTYHYRRVNYVILKDKETQAQFCFANAHFHNGMNSPAQSIRAQQAGYLMDILDEVTADKNLPVILVGDFNGGTKTDTLADVITGNRFSDSRALADTVEDASNATWNTGYSDPTNYGGASRIMDHCFVSEGVPVARFRVATEKYPDANGNMLCTSDHFPLVVDISNAVPASPDPSWYNNNATEHRIYDAADLLAFAEQLKKGTNFDGKTVYLCNDIALSRANSYSAANKEYPFSGIFDGQGYVISGLSTIDNENATGLIPYVSNTAFIQNVTVVNSRFTGASNVSAVVGVYSATETDATLTMTNVHVEDTVINGTTGAAAIIGMMGNFEATGVSVSMEDITFVGGSVSAVSHSGGIIGIVENKQENDYANGVTLTMDDIVASGTFSFTGTGTVASGCLIGDVSGFRSINITDVYTGGSLTAVAGAAGVTPFVACVETVNTSSVMDNDAAAVRSTLNISNALATPELYNASHYLLVEGSAYSWSAVVTMKNTLNDTSNLKEGSPGRKGPVNADKNYPDANDDYPTADDHKKTTADLIGKQLFDGWMVTSETSYPVPTVRPVRLLGYQSSYATDVTANGNDTYSIRLIAAMNDDFYTFAGFDNITITYTDNNGKQVKEKATYYCKYAYESVLGVNKAGASETYAASDYYAYRLIALEITGIPKNVTEFEVTLNAFVGNGEVSLTGLTKTVQISVTAQ